MRVIVLGGGPGGYSAAFEAARLGAEVTLIEREQLGGTCLNWGCIPTKTILRSAHIVADTRECGRVRPGRRSRDGRHPGSARAQGGHRRRARGPDRVHREAPQGRGRLRRGRLVGPEDRRGRAGRRRRRDHRRRRVILATGSVVFKLPNIDHDMRRRVDERRRRRRCARSPTSIVIIGGGVIGLEFACAYAAFGSKVTRRRAHGAGAAGQRQARGQARRRPRSRRWASSSTSATLSSGRAGRRPHAHDAAERRRARERHRDVRRGPHPELGRASASRGRHRDGPRRRQGRRALPHERRRASTRSATSSAA